MTAERWRVGGKNPYTVYRDHDGPRDAEHAAKHSLGYFRDAADAQRAVDAVNATTTAALGDLASSPAVQRIRDVIDSLVHEVGPYGGVGREALGDHLIAALRDVLAHRCAPAAGVRVAAARWQDAHELCTALGVETGELHWHELIERVRQLAGDAS